MPYYGGNIMAGPVIDSKGNTLSSQAVQSYYNPVKIDPTKKNDNINSWTDYIDIDFDWIWGVDTAKKVGGAVQSAGASVVDAGSSVVRAVGNVKWFILTGLILITAIVVVPRVLSKK